ncbi:Glycosyl transferase family 2 [Rosistilla carotiformis]|uniref:Glycosyl transferase family 2 n=2 Tax=Rosistilla carotiformis TaxID=2528017 RepID=A0A518JLD8_9BACT|nr:Glycosyl transferase family 2 [Rosistilla carotiformis]
MITDDSDNSKTQELVESKYPKVLYQHGPKNGPGANRNSAARMATSDWLIFIDDDCSPQSNWLESFVSMLDQHSPSSPICWLGATIRDGELPSLKYEAPHNPEGTNGITANFAISRQNYLAVGQIDERYRVAFEDIEFFARCQAWGLEVSAAPEVIVLHPIRRIPSPRKLSQRWHGKVVFALDQGASPGRVLWNLPLHAALVIRSRYRGAPWNVDNLYSVFLFGGELLFTIFQTPAWVLRESRTSRSRFWSNHLKFHPAVPKYGF